jgi:hypothetical protein
MNEFKIGDFVKINKEFYFKILGSLSYEKYKDKIFKIYDIKYYPIIRRVVMLIKNKEMYGLLESRFLININNSLKIKRVLKIL